MRMILNAIALALTLAGGMTALGWQDRSQIAECEIGSCD